MDKIIGKRSIPHDIREKLVEKAVLESQLESTYRAQKRHNKDKDVRGRILAGSIVRQDGPPLPPNLRFTNSLAPSPIYAPTSSGHI